MVKAIPLSACRIVERCSKESFSIVSEIETISPVTGRRTNEAKSTTDINLRDLKDLFSDGFMTLYV